LSSKKKAAETNSQRTPEKRVHQPRLAQHKGKQVERGPQLEQAELMPSSSTLPLLIDSTPVSALPGSPADPSAPCPQIIAEVTSDVSGYIAELTFKILELDPFKGRSPPLRTYTSRSRMLSAKTSENPPSHSRMRSASTPEDPPSRSPMLGAETPENPPPPLSPVHDHASDSIRISSLEMDIVSLKRQIDDIKNRVGREYNLIL
jgi:hypothetical protein